MARFDLGQRVKVVHGDGEPFCGRIARVSDPGPVYYRVEAQGEDGLTYSMTVEESWLEPDEEPDEEPEMVWRKTRAPFFDAGCLAQSLKSLCFALGGTHVAGWVEEAERAAWKGMVVRYER
jgi:hypothetical protein